MNAANALHFVKVKLGRDFGMTVEITAGLADGATVVANPNDALSEGQVVEPLAPAAGKNG